MPLFLSEFLSNQHEIWTRYSQSSQVYFYDFSKSSIMFFRIYLNPYTLERQKSVSAYLKSEQILPFVFARQYAYARYRCLYKVYVAGDSGTVSNQYCVLVQSFYLYTLNNCNRRFFTAKRLIIIPGITYQNLTPMEEWEIYFWGVQRKVAFVVFSGVILLVKF